MAKYIFNYLLLEVTLALAFNNEGFNIYLLLIKAVIIYLAGKM